MVERLLPRSAAIFGSGHPRAIRNSMRFLSAIELRSFTFGSHSEKTVLNCDKDYAFFAEYVVY